MLLNGIIIKYSRNCEFFHQFVDDSLSAMKYLNDNSVFEQILPLMASRCAIVGRDDIAAPRRAAPRCTEAKDPDTPVRERA